MSQNTINTHNPEESNYQPSQVHDDDKGKYYKEKHAITFAQNYLKTDTAKGMDEKNKTAMKVWANKGHNAAAAYMMEQAGGDYSRMRSMYG
jgi:hypothetical protein